MEASSQTVSQRLRQMSELMYQLFLELYLQKSPKSISLDLAKQSISSLVYFIL